MRYNVHVHGQEEGPCFEPGGSQQWENINSHQLQWLKIQRNDASPSDMGMCVCIHIYIYIYGHLAQGLYGAPTAKPTTLLVLNMDDLESKLHSGRICPNVEKGVSIGKNAMGQFHTAPLKEYPPGFCKAIAASFTHNFCIQGTCVDHSTVADIPQSFLDLCYKMQDHDFGDYIGVD